MKIVEYSMYVLVVCFVLVLRGSAKATSYAKEDIIDIYAAHEGQISSLSVTCTIKYSQSLATSYKLDYPNVGISWIKQAGKETLSYYALSHDARYENGDIYFDGSKSYLLLRSQTDHPLAILSGGRTRSLNSSNLARGIFGYIHDVMPIKDFLKSSETKIVDTSVPIGGRSCILLKGADQVLWYQVWLDPARGCVPMKIEWGRGDKLVGRYDSFEYVSCETGNGGTIWYPVGAVIHAFSPSKFEYLYDMKIEVQSVEFNRNFPDDTFVPKFKVGTKVQNQDLGVTYVIGPGGEEEPYLPPAGSVSKLKQSKSVGKSSQEKTALQHLLESNTPRKLVVLGYSQIIILGLALVAGIIFFYWLWDRKRRTKHYE